MKKKKIKSDITVIIPFYNGKSYIKRALLSLKKEILKSDQIIIINDGSTRLEDIEYLRRIIIDFPIPIELVNTKNNGQSMARNVGAKLAKTKFITFLDQDDMAYPLRNMVLKNCLENAMLGDSSCCYAYGDVTRINKNDYVLENNFSSKRESKINNKKNCFNFETKKYIYKDLFRLVGSALFVRKKFLESGGFDPNLIGYEDDDLFLNLHLSKYTFAKTKQEVLYWRLNRFSTSYTDRFKISRFKYFKKLLKLFKKNHSHFFELIVTRFMFRFTIDLFMPLFNLSIFRGNFLKSIKCSLSIFKKSNKIFKKLLSKTIQNNFIKLIYLFKIYILNKILYFIGLSKLVLLK